MALFKIKYETFHKNDHKNKYPTEKIISKMEVSLKISLRNNVNFGGYVRNGDIDRDSTRCHQIQNLMISRS